ncbi:MAG: hypothetical protein IT258_04710 [Saprospiraceae bacterium]|nr:hypothetical protein [Saprospiraceae bacterium]
MNLSSRTTYFFPFILLFLASLYFILFCHVPLEFIRANTWINHFNRELAEYFLNFISALALTIILFFVFKKTAGLFTKYKYLKYFLFLPPIVIYLIMEKNPDFHLVPIIAGLILFSSFSGLSNRYMGYLTDTTIDYKNILGQPGVVNLKDLVQLEQKNGILSLSKAIRLLNLSRKTVVTFIDERIDECEITIFTKTFNAENVFSSIVNNAKKCGNLKIRQYAF